ncbi:D-alanyl-D-alanine carboxypeptidase [Streptomyces sp. NPDC006335]|uniref:D-alanyl-D-alanine carboxypeptidase n=1 Tax=Streptomyces sp. NPDC006335 TaxID=3156895 RepID=UPI0033A695B6
MEEASVAGESPDRSKQRESSAEPTSGSASPVPEARSSARDPRLAVARESISLGGVDTATRIFSVRDLPKSPEAPEDADGSPVEADAAGSAGSGAGKPEDAPEAPEKGSGEAEGAESADGDSDTAEGSEDTSTAEAAEESGTTEDSDGSGTAEAADESRTAEDPDDSGTAEAADESRTAEDPDESRTAETADDSRKAEAADESRTAETADDSRKAEAADESRTAEDLDGSGTPMSSGVSDSGSGEGGEPGAAGDARLRDAVAAWVATGDGSDKAKAAEKSSEKSAETPEGKPAEKLEGKDAGPADEAPEAESAPETDSAPEPARESDAAETAVAEETPADDAPDEAPQADGENVDADVADKAPTGPQADDAPDKAAQADDGPGDDGAPEDSEPEDAKPQGSSEPGDDADVADEPPVDQPTAVFKAPRPPVDQPTTMLKLGKAPDAKPEAKPEPEAAAERTSRFVALKALDEPREARPKADVTAAVPQVGPERTTQQPLPPKPPLDLLAELTNTPPPPPTPLRTLGRRVKIWTPLLILLVVVFAIVQALRPLPEPTLSLTAEDSYTFDGSRANLPWPTQGQGWMDVNGVGTMGNFGKQTPVAIGSVAKAMTAYIVLKDHPLKSGEEGAKITVDALAEKEGGYNKQGESTLNTVKEGDVLTQRQAIAAIMIPSANNIARLLARWDAGSEAAFIKKMNDTARELGMKNTKYTDASGLKETTVSSAEDQVKLGNELVKIPALMEITSMGQWVDPSGQKWYNYNYLVPYTGIGIKTGTTSAAGGNLLFASRKEVGGETVTVVGAILGQHKAPIIKTVNDVSKVALLAAEGALKSTKILKKGDVVGYVDDGLGGHTPVVLTKDVTAVGWAGFKVKLSFAADEVPHTAKAGTKVGTLTVGDGEGGAVKVPVTLQKDLTEPGLTDKLTRVG